jgi:putative glutamine amidotransferase
MSDGGLAAWLEAVQPGAVVLSGGNDIGQHPQRDHTEQRLLSYASTHGLPVLGICRGMQMMGVWVGGKIRPVVGHIRTRHQFDGEISGDGNSYHNHVLSECPVGYKVLARSEDGEIEAIRHATLPWEGWMWHPEREVPFSTRDIERLRALLGE